MEDPLRPPDDPGFRLIETVRWTPEGGIRHRREHLARLGRSADALGISPEGLEVAIGDLTGPGPLRVRLTVDAEGRVDLSSRPFTLQAPDAVWRVTLANERLTAADPWLRHKTTIRPEYDAARAALPRGVDEAILLNEAGEVCDGTITTVFADMGDGLLTPPLRCGVLPGILRERMLAAGKADEAVLKAADLHAAERLFLGNSLRGLIQAELG